MRTLKPITHKPVLKLLSRSSKGWLAERADGSRLTLPAHYATESERATYFATHKERVHVHKEVPVAKKGKTNVGDPIIHGTNPAADSFKGKGQKQGKDKKGRK